MDYSQEIKKAFLELDRLKDQVGRIASHIDSEKGSIGRETKRIRDDIEKIENQFKEILYGKDGILIKIDRLEQESLTKKKTKQNIIALWIAVVIMFLQALFQMFKKFIQ